MLQVADDLVQVIKLLEEHPEVQLASIALLGFPLTSRVCECC